VKIDNSSIERVEEFKYLGKKLTDQNSVQEEIRSRLKLGNACYHSVQNLLSSIFRACVTLWRIFLVSLPCLVNMVPRYLNSVQPVMMPIMMLQIKSGKN
jgi:hypothetical protein